MNEYESWEIAGHALEYLDDSHEYLVDGIIVPSITTMLKSKFGGKYEGVDQATLKRASEKGTEVHQAIQDWCEKGTESELPEVRNFKFLQKQYGFEVMENEVPVILFYDDEPVSAGRLDLVLMMDGKTGLADIKRTSTLDKEYLAHQLNLYRIAYTQSYGIDIDFLRGIHLREDTRKFVTIPIKVNETWDFIYEYQKGVKHGDI